MDLQHDVQFEELVLSTPRMPDSEVTFDQIEVGQYFGVPGHDGYLFCMRMPDVLDNSQKILNTMTVSGNHSDDVVMGFGFHDDTTKVLPLCFCTEEDQFETLPGVLCELTARLSALNTN